MAKESLHTTPIFKPRFFLKNRHIQSIFASLKFLTPPHGSLLANSRDLIIETQQNSKLLANYSQATGSRGLLIILHGWEGSSSSAYVMAASSFFYNQQFSVCRLNLRDHGESHHLNEGLFHGALLEETFDAVQALSRMSQGQPVFLLGFSLGANFSLRIAMKHRQTPIPDLRRVFAISPPLDPYKTTLAIDHGPVFYRKYFMNKWKNSLKIKERLFPHKYNFKDMLNREKCLDLTADIMKYYPDFPSYRDYFKLYTLDRSSFLDLDIPVSIIISADDPVIPIDDFNTLCENEYLKIIRQPRGGHCGFIDLFPYRRWYHDLILESMKS